LEATEPRAQSTSSIISREIVRLHARLYGRGPTKAKTYVHAEYVLSALEDIFTPAEVIGRRRRSGWHGLVRRSNESRQDERPVARARLLDRANALE
jgi:hypothetical protein